MKYYIIAGEASGDLHGGNLVRELKKQDPEASIRAWGGDHMHEAGAVLVKHYRDLAFMGFAEVVANLGTILKNLKFCKADILQFRPDVLVLIDYPGFNIRIAEWAKASKIKVIYYISPQVWAWKENRVKILKKCVDRMLVILPFEKDFYKKWDYQVEYVGHPLIQVIENFEEQIKQPGQLVSLSASGKPVIAILPGSRRQEVKKKLPVMLEVSRAFPDHEFILARAPSLEDSFYEPMIRPYNNVSAVRNQTYELLSQSVAALVTSGTATLETALFGVPEVVCYKGSPISYQIAKRVIRVPYISLVNLIMNKEVVKELIQDQLTAENLGRELHAILENKDRREQIMEDYRRLREILRQGGQASARAAGIIIDFLRKLNPNEKAV